MTVTTKLCPGCKEIKPLTDFPPNKTYKLGVSSHCRQCNNASTKKWRNKKLQENPSFYHDIYKANPEAGRLRTKRYNERHKDELKRKRKENYNPRKAHELHAKYYQIHKEEWRVQRWLCGYTMRNRDKNGYRPIAGFFRTQGICLFCGELNPLLMQNAHVFPKHHDLLISLCPNCHWMLDHYPMMIDLDKIP